MPPAQHYLDGRQLVAASPHPPCFRSPRPPQNNAWGIPPAAPQRRRSFSPPTNAMAAAAATWTLASPSSVVENRAASPRQTPATPHCLGLPPRRRLLRASSSCERAARGVILMSRGITTRRSATGETVAAASSVEEQESTELPEIVQTAQKAWEKVEDKYAVATIGVAAIVALWASAGVVSAIDRLPLIPGVLELVGIGYTGWFVYQNVVFKPDREALLEKIKNTYSDITGSS